MFYILGFYKFKRLTGLKKLKETFQIQLVKYNLKGTIIFSKEGINGTISGKKNNIKKIKSEIKKICKIKNFDSENISTNNFQPFHRGKTKIKKEVVPLGIQISPSQKLNNSVEPKEWNSLLLEKDIKIIDARKPFEFELGTFKGAKNPKINNFRDFPKYLKKFNKKNKIAMFCTGGIRCEKASVYLKRKGFKKIFQLKGGILNYLKKINQKQSLWRGECYVFDNRISLRHKLKVGTYSMCSACRKPVSLKEKKSIKFVEGISCPKCHDHLTQIQKARFAMRQKQILAAKKMGKKYIFQKEYF
tara:strand:- start:20012 stop:20917 length:906 start_codon:yes stop_codon:yes gene_type:complete